MEEIDWKDACFRILYSVVRSESYLFQPWFGIPHLEERIEKEFDEYCEKVLDPEAKIQAEEYKRKNPELFKGKV